jgi:hypothetical protein
MRCFVGRIVVQMCQWPPQQAQPVAVHPARASSASETVLPLPAEPIALTFTCGIAFIFAPRDALEPGAAI